MKSQDVLLLLKLAALEREAHFSAAALGEPPDHLTAASGASMVEDSPPDNGNVYAFPSWPEPESDPYSVRGLSSAIGISRSEVSNALGRCYANGLARKNRQGGRPLVNRRGLEEFLSYGIKYVFPAQTLGLARGIPTGLTAPIFDGILHSAAEHMPVWPDPHGDMLGIAVEPLYKTVTSAIRRDTTLYKLLAVVDSIRMGQPRERKLAIAQLHQLLDY